MHSYELSIDNELTVVEFEKHLKNKLIDSFHQEYRKLVRDLTPSTSVLNRTRRLVELAKQYKELNKTYKSSDTDSSSNNNFLETIHALKIAHREKALEAKQICLDIYLQNSNILNISILISSILATLISSIVFMVYPNFGFISNLKLENGIYSLLLSIGILLLIYLPISMKLRDLQHHYENVVLDVLDDVYIDKIKDIDRAFEI